MQFAKFAQGRRRSRKRAGASREWVERIAAGAMRPVLKSAGTTIAHADMSWKAGAAGHEWIFAKAVALTLAPSDLWLLLDSSGIGGIETHVLTLAQGLAAAAIPASVVFLADHGPHPLKAELARAGIPYTNVVGGLFGLARLMRRRCLLWSIRMATRRVSLDDWLPRRCARRSCLPITPGEPGVGRVRLYLALDRITARLGHSIAVSEQIRPAFARRYRPD